METARVQSDSHWLTLSGAVPAGGPEQSSPQKDTAGEGTFESRAHPFPPHLSISALPGAEVWGFAGIFQELSVPAAELATSKMEAACAPPLSANLQNYSLSGFSPMQDGRLGSEPAAYHSQHGSQFFPFRPRSVMPAVTIFTHFRFLSAGETVGCWVEGRGGY